MSRRHPVTAYAEQVARGKIPAGAWHRLACERHLSDLQTGKARGLRFHGDLSTKAIGFFPGVLRHYQGEWSGTRLELQPWQQFIVGSLWGWRREDGLRRFRTALVEVPRGNGKSVLAGGLGIMASFFDDEPGAHGYIVATKKDQARIVFEAARRMVIASPHLRTRIEPQRHQLLQEDTACKLVPLGADADTLDGLRPHIVIADEVHAHKTGDLIEIMQTGMGTRRQPILFEITTAGGERTSIWGLHREYTRQIVEATVEDDAWFGLICCADEDDDWQDPDVWRKANPNFGISVKRDYLEQECRKAVNIPANEPGFRRLHLGQLVEGDARIIPRQQWDACGEAYDWSAMRGRVCYAGLDLSTTTDLTACTWITEDDDGCVRAWPQVWIPEAKLDASTDRVPYRLWASRGWLTVTPGDVVDYARVRADILAHAGTCTLRAIGFDPWNATETAQQLALRLGEDAVVPVRQGFATMAEPMQRMLALLASGRLRHPMSPVMTWTADNLCVAVDPAGNMKPDKARSQRLRIDPMVALLNALHLWCRLGSQPVAPKKIELSRGVLVL